MTGYGRGSAEVKTHALRVEIEITTVNRKSLDLSVSSPKEWNGLETKCAQWLGGRIQRGRVQVQVKVELANDDDSGFAIDHASMKQQLESLRGFAVAENIPFNPDAQLILELAKTVQTGKGIPAWQELEAEINAAFKAALKGVCEMRQAEGVALAKDLTERINGLEKIRGDIALASESTVANHHTALVERLSKLKLDLDLNDDRVLKEVAIFADRSDISEEITRLESHVAQFKKCLTSPEPSGRKMDFICQEIHREFNTIGSKSASIGITKSVLEAKNALERIREQVQNVE